MFQYTIRPVARGAITLIECPDGIVWLATDNADEVIESGFAPTKPYAITEANIALIRAECVPF